MTVYLILIGTVFSSIIVTITKMRLAYKEELNEINNLFKKVEVDK